MVRRKRMRIAVQGDIYLQCPHCGQLNRVRIKRGRQGIVCAHCHCKAIIGYRWFSIAPGMDPNVEPPDGRLTVPIDTALDAETFDAFLDAEYAGVWKAGMPIHKVTELPAPAPLSMHLSMSTQSAPVSNELSLVTKT